MLSLWAKGLRCAILAGEYADRIKNTPRGPAVSWQPSMREAGDGYLWHGILALMTVLRLWPSLIIPEHRLVSPQQYIAAASAAVVKPLVLMPYLRAVTPSGILADKGEILAAVGRRKEGVYPVSGKRRKRLGTGV